MPSINNFSGMYRFLSNFYIHAIKYDGDWYSSSEHAYQASKTLIPGERSRLRDTLISPGEAKKEGRLVTLRPDWDNIRLLSMFHILSIKFKNPSMLTDLRNTRPYKLIEGNYWNDTYWGVYGGKGYNYLGKLLMLIRDGTIWPLDDYSYTPDKQVDLRKQLVKYK